MAEEGFPAPERRRNEGFSGDKAAVSRFAGVTAYLRGAEGRQTMPMKRPIMMLATAAMLLPLAACYDDGGPRGYGPPPPPPPPPGGYYDNRNAPPPPPPPGGYYADGRAPRGDYYDRDAPPPPPGYDPARDYHDQPGGERPLTRDDRVYRGHDGRYYCKRSDGTTGTVVGAIAGGALGAILGGGGALGTLLGAGGGALLGHSVDQGQVHCR